MMTQVWLKSIKTCERYGQILSLFSQTNRQQTTTELTCCINTHTHALPPLLHVPEKVGS